MYLILWCLYIRSRHKGTAFCENPYQFIRERAKILSILNVYKQVRICKMQKRKNTKLQNIIYNIQTISKIVFVYLCKTLRFLCKKAKNRAFWGGVFALKCPKNHKTHLIAVGFCVGSSGLWCRFARRRRSRRRQVFGRRASAPSRLSRLWAEVPMKWRTWLRRRPEEEWRLCVPWVRPLRRLPCLQGGREGLWAGFQEICVGLVSLSDPL